MKFVEQTPFPPFVWAKDISVELCGNELEVSGTAVLSDDDARVSPDPLREYRQALRSEKRQGKKAPHVQFANADSDKKLIDFVRRFGPVVAKSLRTEDLHSQRSEDVVGLGEITLPRTRTILVARQDLEELRTEAQTYDALLKLISELRSEKQSSVPKYVRDVFFPECVSMIVRNVSLWPRQWERERELRASGQGYAAEPEWLFRPDNLQHLQQFQDWATRPESKDPMREALAIDPIHAAHLVICELINAFNPRVYLWGDTPVEAPGFDLTGGIRPVLYYILRRQYLLESRSIRICRNRDCRQLFEIERQGEEFCRDECSRHQRQREYYHKRGKGLRKRRLKGKERKSVDRNPSR